MDSDKNSTFGPRYKHLAEKLSQLPSVIKHDKGEHKEAWTLAHSFLDLEESFKKFTDIYLPRLEHGNLSDKEVDDLLLDMGEDFRHIIYHLNDPEYFRYLGTMSNQEDSK